MSLILPANPIEPQLRLVQPLRRPRHPLHHSRRTVRKATAVSSAVLWPESSCFSSSALALSYYSFGGDAGTVAIWVSTSLKAKVHQQAGRCSRQMYQGTILPAVQPGSPPSPNRSWHLVTLTIPYNRPTDSLHPQQQRRRPYPL